MEKVNFSEEVNRILGRFWNWRQLPEQVMKKEICIGDYWFSYSVRKNKIKIYFFLNLPGYGKWTIIGLDEAHGKMHMHLGKNFVRKGKTLIKVKENIIDLEGTDRIEAIKTFCLECQKYFKF